MGSKLFVIGIVAVLVAVANATKIDPMEIAYYCDIDATKFSFNVENLHKDDYSFAIASKPTTFDKIQSNATTPATSSCFQKFKPLSVVGTKVTGTFTELICPNIAAETMHLYVMKTSLANIGIGGVGFQAYSLPCDITESGKTVVVKKTFTDSPSIVPSTTKIPSILKMTIESKAKATTNFVVGEELTVTIQVDHTSSEYFLRVEDCAATDGTGKSSFDLVTGEDPVNNDVIPPSQELGSDPTTQNTKVHPIHFTMNAFKFYNSDDVIVTCSVRVCTKAGQTTCDKTNRRRKRSASEVSVDMATTRFTVRDQVKNERSSGQPLRVSSLATVITVISILYSTVL